MNRSYEIMIPVIVLISFCSSCRNQVKEKVSQAERSFPIEYVIQNAPIRKKIYNLDSIDFDALREVDSTLLKEYLSGMQISNHGGDVIKFDPFGSYYFFDKAETDSLWLFSIIHPDEVGYTALFHFTYDKLRKRLVYADLIATNGGDGGYGQSERLKYFSDQHLRVFTHGEDSQDIEKGFLITVDSIIQDFKFERNRSYNSILYQSTKTDTVYSD